MRKIEIEKINKIKEDIEYFSMVFAHNKSELEDLLYFSCVSTYKVIDLYIQEIKKEELCIKKPQK